MGKETDNSLTKIVAASEKILIEDCEKVESLYSRKALTQAQAAQMLKWADARHTARVQQWTDLNFVPA